MDQGKSVARQGQGRGKAVASVCMCKLLLRVSERVRCTVEPQSYGLHSTENLVNRTPRSNTYLVSIIKSSMKWERVIMFSSVTKALASI